MEKESIEEKYNKIKSKYSLPDFNKLDFEFEISDIEDGKFVLREVRRKIIEKIETFCKMLEEVLQPEATVANLQESTFFDEKEKEELFKLFSRLMRYNRKSLCLGLNPNDEKEAMFISTVFNEWDGVKKELTYVLRKLKEAWEKKSEIKEKLQYFG